MADNEERVHASVYLTQSSPKTKDWVDAYKKDPNTNLMLNHLTKRTKPFEPVFINSVHKVYCAHLREQRIKLLDNKLVCYIPIG